MDNQLELKKAFDYFKRNNFVKACDYFELYLYDEKNKNSQGKKTDINSELFYIYAVCLCRLSRWEKAIKELIQIKTMKIKPFYQYQSYMLLGYIFCQLGHYIAAEDHLYWLLKHNIENPQIYSMLGYIFYIKKDYPQAEYYYKKSLSLNDKNANANNGMGYNYLEWQGLEDKGFIYLKKAYEIDPENYAYLDSLGWYYKLKKKFEKALYYLNKSLKLNKNEIVESHLKSLKKELE